MFLPQHYAHGAGEKVKWKNQARNPKKASKKLLYAGEREKVYGEREFKFLKRNTLWRPFLIIYLSLFRLTYALLCFIFSVVESSKRIRNNLLNELASRLISDGERKKFSEA